MRSTLPFAILLLSSACATVAPPLPSPLGAELPTQANLVTQEPTLTYPATRRTDQSDLQFGISVADPYRWLEQDVRNDREVADGSPHKIESPTLSLRRFRCATGSRRG